MIQTMKENMSKCVYSDMMLLHINISACVLEEECLKKRTYLIHLMSVGRSKQVNIVDK